MVNLLDFYKGQALHIVLLVTSLKLKGTMPIPSAQGVVGVGPSFFVPFFEDFGFNQLVMQIVEIVLHFAP